MEGGETGRKLMLEMGMKGEGTKTRKLTKRLGSNGRRHKKN